MNVRDLAKAMCISSHHGNYPERYKYPCDYHINRATDTLNYLQKMAEEEEMFEIHEELLDTETIEWLESL